MFRSLAMLWNLANIDRGVNFSLMFPSFTSFVLFLIVAFCSSYNNRGLLDDKTLKNPGKLFEFITTPGVFVPGYLMSQVFTSLSISGNPFKPSLFCMDLNDLYIADKNIAPLIAALADVLGGDLTNMNDVQVANFVFQLDSLLDHLLLQRNREKYLATIREVIELRSRVVSNLNAFLPYRKVLLDAISICPSFRIETFIKEHPTGFTFGGYDFSIPPTGCLAIYDKIRHVPAFKVSELANLKSLFICLLSSRLEDNAISEHEKQLWFNLFADCSFWMSSRKIAIILVSALRAGRFEELNALQYSFQLKNWRTVSFFMSPEELKSLPLPFRDLTSMTAKLEPHREFVDAILTFLREQSCNQLIKHLEIIQTDRSVNDDLLHALAKVLPAKTANEEEFLLELFKSPQKILNLSIILGIILGMGSFGLPLLDRIPNIYRLGCKKALMSSLFVEMNALSPTVLPPDYAIVFNSKCTPQPAIVAKSLCSVTLYCVRNHFLMVESFLESDLRSLRLIYHSAPFADISIKKFPKWEMFSLLCDVILKFENIADSHCESKRYKGGNLAKDLTALNFTDVLSTSRLSDYLKSLIVESLIGYFIAHNRTLPAFLWEIHLKTPICFSKTAARRRNLNIPSSDELNSNISMFFAEATKKLIKSSGGWTEIFLWALIPRIMDGEEGVKCFLEFQKKLKARKPNFSIAFEKYSTVTMVEFASTQSLSQFVPHPFIIRETLSTQKRIQLLHSKFVLDQAVNCNYLELLGLKNTVGPDTLMYLPDYFAGKVKLSPNALARNIIGSIMMIGGLKKPLRILPRAFIHTIFLDNGEPLYQEIRMRIRYELDEYIYLSLLPKELRERLVDMLSFEDEPFGEKEIYLLKDIFGEKFHELNLKIPQALSSFSNIDNLTSSCSSSSSVSISSPSSPTISASVSLSNDSSPSSSPSSSIAPISSPHVKRNRMVTRKDRKETPKKSEEQTKNESLERTSLSSYPSTSSGTHISSSSPASPIQSITICPSALNSAILKPINVEEKQNKETTCFPIEQKEVKTPSIPSVLTKEKTHRKCRLTLEMIRQNVEFKEDGQVLPYPYPSQEFQECVTQYLESGELFPFLFSNQFFVFITANGSFDECSRGKSAWKPMSSKRVKSKSHMSLWKPMPHQPVKVFLLGHSIDETVSFKKIIMELHPITLGRLQSLIFFSSRMLHRDIRVRVEPGSKYFVRNGWLHVPQWKDAEVLKEEIETVIDSYSSHCESKSAFWEDHMLMNKLVKREAKKKEYFTRRMARPYTNELVQTIEDAVDNVMLDLAFEKSLAEETEFAVSQFYTEEIEMSDGKETPEVKLSNFSSLIVKEQSEIRSSSNMNELVTNFDAFKYNVTQDNFNSAYFHLHSLLQSGNVEYIALDCEMTGLYTQQVEDAFKRGEVRRTSEVNVRNLIEGAMFNSIFQLGLAVKTKDGKISVLSIYTTPNLQRENFTEGAFSYLFTESFEKDFPNHTKEEIQNMVKKKMKRIRQMSIGNIPLKSIVDLLLYCKVPLVVFSGYVDFMHLLKTARIPFNFDHNGVEFMLRKKMNVRFFDIKCTTAQFSDNKKDNKLEHLVKDFRIVSSIKKSNLHDASFDALLTAVCYDHFTEQQLRFRQGCLFNIYQ